VGVSNARDEADIQISAVDGGDDDDRRGDAMGCGGKGANSDCDADARQRFHVCEPQSVSNLAGRICGKPKCGGYTGCGLGDLSVSQRDAKYCTAIPERPFLGENPMLLQ
jgi:hypothetical protein